MGLFKALGGAYQGINSIAEGARKKRDGKKFIAMAEAAQRNLERQDLVNNSAQIKVNSEGTSQALENINLNATQAFSQASDAGIRGIGMIGKIQQNVNQATQVETQRLADKEFAVQQAKAAEQSQIRSMEENRYNQDQARTDQMLERGQALRSQGSAETGAGVSQTGGAIDEGVQAAGKALAAVATGGTSGFLDAATSSPDISNSGYTNAFASFRANRQQVNI